MKTLLHLNDKNWEVVAVKIDLFTFSLECFDESKKEHIHLIQEFSGDSSSTFIHSIEERLLQNNHVKSFPFNTGFVISSYAGSALGYLFISSISHDEVFLEYSILKENRGKGIGKLCLQEVTDYLFEHYNLRGIKLDIDPSNAPSTKIAMECGYYPDEEEFLNRNMVGRILYRKDNFSYINRNRKGK